MPAAFVELAPGARTYLAHIDTRPDFTAAAAAPDAVQRKVFAYTAQRSAEQTTLATATPKLDALRAQGLIQGYELIPGTGTVIINANDAKAGAAFQAIRGVSEIGRIVRNRQITLNDQVVPTDTSVAPAGAPEYNVAKVNAPAVWKTGDTGQGVVVGMVDTGADVAHEALKEHYRGTNADGTETDAYNWVDLRNNKPTPYDDEGHGSHTTGTAVGGTADHVIGVAPGAKFIAAKVFDAQGSSDDATLLKGLSWMMAPTDATGQNPDPSKAPDIVSNSWGGEDGADTTYLNTLKGMLAQGIVPVFAAGNSGPKAGTVGNPGSLDEALTVGATDQDDRIASFSSRGPSPIKGTDGKPLLKPDVSAPGVDITSVQANGDEHSYTQMDGTSMATPAVAGAVALLKSKFPTITPAQVKDVLERSAVDLGTRGPDDTYGYGRIDVAAALKLAAQVVSAGAVN